MYIIFLKLHLFQVIMTLIEAFLKTKRVQKTLSTKPGEEGFSLIELVVVIAVLAILSAVAIPSFTNVQANARASAVQNGLVNGIKECFVKEAEGERTQFGDVVTFKSGNLSAFRGFTIAERDKNVNTCFAAKATSEADGSGNKLNADFEIYIDGDGVAIKTCSDSSKAGCKDDGLKDKDGNSKGTGKW